MKKTQLRNWWPLDLLESPIKLKLYWPSRPETLPSRDNRLLCHHVNGHLWTHCAGNESANDRADGGAIDGCHGLSALWGTVYMLGE